MASAQRISPNAIDALMDALISVFWLKRDVLAYLRSAVEDERLLSGIDWLGQDVYKRESVGRFVDRLASDQAQHRELLLRLMGNIAEMDDFPRLAWLEDAGLKIAQAREAVLRLRRYMQPYEATLAAQAAARDRITEAQAEAQRRRAMLDAVAALRERYMQHLVMDDAQRRGFDFEPFLHDLFDTFDLDPRASFRIHNEQIDGGFTLDTTHFILEARWRKQLASRDDLGSFRDKVDQKAEKHPRLVHLGGRVRAFGHRAPLTAGVTAAADGRGRPPIGLGRADRPTRPASAEAPPRVYDGGDLPDRRPDTRS